MCICSPNTLFAFTKYHVVIIKSGLILNLEISDFYPPAISRHADFCGRVLAVCDMFVFVCVQVRCAGRILTRICMLEPRWSDLVRIRTPGTSSTRWRVTNSGWTEPCLTRDTTSMYFYYCTKRLGRQLILFLVVACVMAVIVWVHAFLCCQSIWLIGARLDKISWKLPLFWSIRWKPGSGRRADTHCSHTHCSHTAPFITNLF